MRSLLLWLEGYLPNKILIPLQSLISCFLEPLGTGGRQWAQLRDSERLLFGMSQRHYLLGPNSCYPSWWGFFCPYSSLCQESDQWKLSIGQEFSRFSGRLWRGFLGTFSLLLFPSVLQLSLPGLEHGQNPGCLALGPNEAQALMSYYKNSLRDKVISKRWIC